MDPARARRSGRRPTAAVIGGGFSGLLTAIHLLRSDPQVIVQLIERAPAGGEGRAFRTSHPDHLLNVRAANMSAFPDQPGHFVSWLAGEGAAEDFVRRGRYGDYLRDLLRREFSDPVHGDRLILVCDEAETADRERDGWNLGLRSGRTVRADAVVLAVGPPPPAAPPGAQGDVTRASAYIADPWACDLAALPMGEALLIGSGLTMVDVALSLAADGRRLTAVSRRGLAPLAHAHTEAAPPPPGRFDTPGSAAATLRAYAEAVGWRAAVDSIRPRTCSIWRSWSLAERRRFLRHLRPWWDIHRHRMAPPIARRLDGMIAEGGLQVMAGKLEELRCVGDGFEAAIRPRGQTRAIVLRFDAVINCTSAQGDPEQAGAGLLAGLHRAGWVRRDPLGIGIAVDEDLRVIAADGAPAGGLFAIGPLTRGAVWEAVAVPDLRNQTVQAAQAALAWLKAAAV